MELRLTDPNGYTVTVLRDVPTTDIDTTKAHLLDTVAPDHATQWADFGYDARFYTVRVN